MHWLLELRQMDLQSQFVEQRWPPTWLPRGVANLKLVDVSSFLRSTLEPVPVVTWGHSLKSWKFTTKLWNHPDRYYPLFINIMININFQPLQAVTGMAKLWFENGKLEEWLVLSLQFVYDRSGWPLRQALPVAQCIMWIYYLEELCRQSQISTVSVG